MDFVKAKNIKQHLKDKGAGGVSPELIKTINEELVINLDKALERCKANSRSTVMKRDW